MQQTPLFIYEQLSGSDALLTPEGLHLPGTLRLRYRHIRQAWTQHGPPSLWLLVERALLRHKIDEPITYRPHFGSDNQWHLDEPHYERTLPGWHDRDLRQGSLSRRSRANRTAPRSRSGSARDIVTYLVGANTPAAVAVRDALVELAAVFPTSKTINHIRELHTPYSVLLGQWSGRKVLAMERWRYVSPTPFGWELISEAEVLL